ncbi:hypothetical protein [Desulfosporosinus nitroreducens]|uniref:Uncharacterized protein n=1 Tax=Desulfosporosinus nitroreducens TaxID=2018668 RepID=A0ABT8QMQ3_9FIRM|nr:hypothetical protein [Desulfosporosinus nitroreducens]MCO1603895.1 hypothetical protein [Desulfosporosinus nitroreducens]MDO0822613.1 hypothetical protein [Desulfosporosinus nitroreducens]
MILKIIGLLFLGFVLHLATILLSRHVDPVDESNAVVRYLASIVIMGFNILKVFILFAIVLLVINIH